MDALTLLTTRASQPLLSEPAPDADALATMFAAAARAPDHGRLQPWRFLCVRGAGREQLGELFLRGLLQRDPAASTEKQEKARKAPLRAPLLIVTIASPKPHPKVPASEQLLAAGCAAHGLVLAAQALGYGAIWRTGDPCYDPEVTRSLGLAPHESIVGFIYVGTPAAKRAAPSGDISGLVSDWP
jgi:nitroreductase